MRPAWRGDVWSRGEPRLRSRKRRARAGRGSSCGGAGVRGLREAPARAQGQSTGARRRGIDIGVSPFVVPMSRRRAADGFFTASPGDRDAVLPCAASPWTSAGCHGVDCAADAGCARPSFEPNAVAAGRPPRGRWMAASPLSRRCGRPAGFARSNARSHTRANAVANAGANARANPRAAPLSPRAGPPRTAPAAAPPVRSSAAPP